MGLSGSVPDRQARLVELLDRLATGQGVRPSVLPGVRLMRSDHHLPRQPVLYEPSIVVVAQGSKRGYLGGKVYTYDPHSYLVLAAPLPLQVETRLAADGSPMLGFKVGVEVAVVSELLMKLDRHSVEPEPIGRSIHATRIDEPFGDAAVRLLECLTDPTEAAVLGPQIMRELVYRVLCGQRGSSLRALAATHGRLGRIHRALRRMHEQYAKPMNVDGLADELGMSQSSFHQHFKAVTASSPLQYLKAIRLHQARTLMVHDGLTASEAAVRVGYQSASQFSREFKRYFAVTPQAEAVRLRHMLGLDAFDQVPVGVA